jgi:dynein heavy chain 2, cytosolic
VLLLKTKSVVMDVIHNMDVIDQLSAALKSQGQIGADDWVWQKQLRFQMEPNESGSRICRTRMCDASFDYTYEYQGNAPRLVHTPLTDKCYLTLTQGMHLGYGGNPYGPAGTGKTESVKALAQALGRQCLVFNCDEGIDFKSMGRIFTGLVKCGKIRQALFSVSPFSSSH